MGWRTRALKPDRVLVCLISTTRAAPQFSFCASPHSSTFNGSSTSSFQSAALALGDPVVTRLTVPTVAPTTPRGATGVGIFLSTSPSVTAIAPGTVDQAILSSLDIPPSPSSVMPNTSERKNFASAFQWSSGTTALKNSFVNNSSRCPVQFSEFFTANARSYAFLL